MIRLALTFGLIVIAMNSQLVSAHHSFSATFDSEKHLAIEGVVTNFLFKNPHLLIYLDSVDEQGVVTNWMGEGDAATRYRHAGWDKDALKTGDLVRISGSGTHDDSPMIWIEEVNILHPASGEVMSTINHRNVAIPITEAGTAKIETIPLVLETGEPNFTGAWVENRATSARPPWANDPQLPFNQLGAAVQASWDVTNDPQIFCEPAGLVRKSSFTPHPLAIQQFPDRIVFTYEEYSDERTVFLDRENEPSGQASAMGNSVARYEDDKLIIETTNLSASSTSLLGNYYSDQARVTETYYRDDNPQYGSQITTVTTVEDGKYLTEPWTISRTKLYSEDYQLTETECHRPLRTQMPAVRLSP